MLLPILMSAAVHKFYVSVTNIEYVEDQRAFQITTRIFIDDLEEVLNTRYDIDAALTTDKELADIDTYISKYLKNKILIRINGELIPFKFLGKEYRDDLVVCYLEIEQVDLSALRSIEVTNDVLTELFEEQQNVVHLKIAGTKKSFILVRENNKGMLNL